MSGSCENATYGAICLAGGAGGVAQLFVNCPVDIVKIKMQMQTGKAKIC